ncbi:Isocitrate dehydrogenase phosphatase [Labilithrix luteola]|uniref:Isocitrate dehydrogenase phosphatase n=1 Tax=Labilithrix luteola TaxID=1391654 RepID=A0A0K1Q2T1_9BACT|nr:bifunctional isocitrate dehydrogenase kinase/phosphatase [Labilithrix luteola]AKV00038.1 Isocitrate dehydrogenase phosphatase [Labilithrix luteola]
MKLSIEIAQTILDGFDKHYRLFRATSVTAKERYELADWAGARAASLERIDMYDERVEEAVAAVEESFPTAGREETLWPKIKRAYIDLLYEHKQPECAETFFNSVARRVLDRQYYRNEYIFDRPAISTEHLDGTEPTYRCYYPRDNELRETFLEILRSFDLKNPFQDLPRDIERILQAIAERYPQGWERRPNYQLQVLRSLFFRNKAAYVVGRVVNGTQLVPFVVPLLKDDIGQVYVDTLLFETSDIGRIFSLGRAYFMVDMEVPSAFVAFLQTLLPNKPKHELYTMVGLQKQGKTIFFRDLQHHLKHSTDQFAIAQGTKGMVMLVFTLPSFPHVFKVIRDWFAPPKDTDRKTVEERYLYVKRHDRVGRMADTLEYAHVAFPRERFDPALIEELQRLAPSSVECDGDQIIIEHLYTERRLVPLDVYLRDADEAHTRLAIRDYGTALKDLAGADIFPGDLLLKNFGVTRYGRIVFYDYDELTTLTDCRFRSLPKPRNEDDEMASEPWYAVDPRDVFPEQFPTFLFPAGPLREMFLEEHGDLALASTWAAQQHRLREGVQEDLFPYARELRFCVRYGDKEEQGHDSTTLPASAASRVAPGP